MSLGNSMKENSLAKGIAINLIYEYGTHTKYRNRYVDKENKVKEEHFYHQQEARSKMHKKKPNNNAKCVANNGIAQTKSDECLSLLLISIYKAIGERALYTMCTQYNAVDISNIFVRDPEKATCVSIDQLNIFFVSSVCISCEFCGHSLNIQSISILSFSCMWKRSAYN